MGILGGQLGYRLLRAIAPSRRFAAGATEVLAPDGKLEHSFGSSFFAAIRGKTVLDFGCGNGSQSVAMALQGAFRVIGVDIQPAGLLRARELAERHGVADRCTFTAHSEQLADVIVSKDAFEHFADPAAILQHMSTLLAPGGCVLAAFGPTWLHPHGGHLFSVFPWAHLVFTERALIRWRADFKSDGATRFAEVEGGLNELTIRRFEQVVGRSPFRFEYLETVPIKGLSLLKSRWLREIGSSLVRCKLVRKPAG